MMDTSEVRLVREDEVNGDTYISPTSGSGVLPVNTWGISMDNTNFRGIPEKDESTGGLELRRTNVSCECGESFGVYYGVRVNQETIAGDYVGKIVYTVVVN
jgi:hypothetical protein